MSLVKDGFIVVSAETTNENGIFDQVSESFKHMKGMRCHTLFGLERYLLVFAPILLEKDLVIYIDIDTLKVTNARDCITYLTDVASKKSKNLTIYLVSLDLAKLEAIGVPYPQMVLLPILSETKPS